MVLRFEGNMPMRNLVPLQVRIDGSDGEVGCVVDLDSEDLQFPDRSSCSADKLFSLGKFPIAGLLTEQSHLPLQQGSTVNTSSELSDNYQDQRGGCLISR